MPEEYTTDSRGDAGVRQSQTDPYASSRKRNVEPGDTENNLQRVGSPEDFDSEKPAYDRHISDRIHSDRTSSTEVPDGNEASSSAFQKDIHGDEKKHHHITDMLHRNKSKPEEEEDNNGKDKQTPKFTVWGQFRAIVLGSWINVLLIFCKHVKSGYVLGD